MSGYSQLGLHGQKQWPEKMARGTPSATTTTMRGWLLTLISNVPQVDAGRMDVGDAAWHHGWLLHAAPPNGRRQMRRALAACYFADGARRLKSRRPPQWL